MPSKIHPAAAAKTLTAANDNVQPHGRSTLAVYRSGAGATVHLRISPADAARCGLRLQDRVALVAEDGGYRLSVSAGGRKMRRSGKHLLARATARSAAPFSARTVDLNLEPRGIRITFATTTPVPFSGPLLTVEEVCSLASLRSEGSWQKRRRFLRAEEAAKAALRTTTAGDECYTPRFLIDAVLRAAGRPQFDVDLCSMQPDGAFHRSIKPSSVHTEWGQTPHALRSVEQVIGPVPARSYLTASDAEYGSLQRAWTLEFGWLNPPYSWRSWTVFLEKAEREVACGNARLIVALVPHDNSGEHARHVYAPHARVIELTRQLPFFMRNRKTKGKPHTIATIRQNQLVVFGKGRATLAFLLRLLDELLALGYIVPGQRKGYARLFTALCENAKVA